MTKKGDSLGDRMKEYEYVTRTHLTKRIPVIIRLDGKAFHTFTKKMEKPFDDILVKTMQRTMQFLCENIQGCVFGYTQSDEITLLLTDYKKTTSCAWFDYNTQKMTSISASMATYAFNKFFKEEYYKALDNKYPNSQELDKDCEVFVKRYEYALNNPALFDSRVFSIPKVEVCNCFIWRQQDAVRNSIQSVGQANFTEKELHKKSCSKIKDFLLSKKHIIWEDFATVYKRGSACYKEYRLCIDEDDRQYFRGVWFIDENIPTFTEDRYFVEQWVYISEDD